MPKDNRAKIKAVAAAKEKDRAAQWPSLEHTLVDRTLPIEMMVDREPEIATAFDVFIDLSRSAWGISVGAVRDMRLPLELLRQIGTYFPTGVAMRLSQLSGMIRVLDGDDPYCAIVYDANRERAYWMSRIWFEEPMLEPLGLSDLTADRLLGRLHIFATRLQRWEQQHPPVVCGFEPHRRYVMAA